jgi:hypothetical protein
MCGEIILIVRVTQSNAPHYVYQLISKSVKDPDKTGKTW